MAGKYSINGIARFLHYWERLHACNIGCSDNGFATVVALY
jgi:hypothetical protein